MVESKLPKRFYKSVSLQQGPEGYSILLDGRSVRTPARTELRVTGKALAEKLVREWEQQEEFIDPKAMPMTTRTNTALDRVSGREESVVREIAGFAETDLLCYRADSPEGLVKLHCIHWDPVLSWAKTELGAGFKVQIGVSHVQQPAQSLALIASAFSEFDPFELTPLHTMTTSTGSALLVLALAKGHLDADQVWTAAHADEDWQVSQWGEDEEAMARRTLRRAEFDNDNRFLALVRT